VKNSWLAFSQRGRRAMVGAAQYAIVKAYDVAVYLALLPLITRAVSVEVFARLALLTVAANVLLALADLGCGMAVIREIAGERDTSRQREVVATLLASRALIAATIALSIFGLSRIAGPNLERALSIGAIAFSCWTLFLAVSDVLRGQERHAAVAVATAIKSTLWGALTLWWVVLHEGGLEELVAAHAVAYAAALFVALLWLGRTTFSGRPSLAVFRSLLRFGMPVAGYLLMRMASGLDRYLIRFRSSLSGAGFFQLASAPAGAIEALESIWILAAEPYIYGVAESERGAALLRLVRGATAVMGASAVILCLLGPELVSLLSPESYAPALGALPWLTFAAVTRAVTYVIGFGAGAARQTRPLAVVGATELFLAGAGLLLVLPWAGVAGAAMVRLGGALAALPICYRMVRELGTIALPIGRIFSVLVVSTGLCAVIATDTFGLRAPLWLRLAVAPPLLTIGWLALTKQRGQ
jgi:O-antigen/teichoic acid export membrane protein